nr:TRAP transporter substrate-binding protein [Oceanobacter mangrovi]
MGSTQNASAETVRYGLVTPPGHTLTELTTRFDENLKRLSDGQFDPRPSRQAKMGGEAFILENLESGRLQAGMLSTGTLEKINPAFNVWYMPFQFENVEAAARASQSHQAKAMLKTLEANNLIGLGYAFSGMRQLLSPTAISSVEDLKGKKVRAFPNSVFSYWYNQLGAEPKAIPTRDILPALEQNEVDLIDCDLDMLVGLKIYEKAPHLLLTNHMAFPAVFAVSKSWFDALTPENQEIVRKAYSEAEQWGIERQIQAEKTNLRELEQAGVDIVRMQRQDFGAAPDAVVEHYKAENPAIRQFLEM